MSFTLMSGSPGDDNIIGSPDGDLIQGGDGNDLLSGYGGHDSIEGGDGRDDIAGDHRIGILSGNAGDDTLDGGDGGDVLRGEWGSDSLIGGLGDDILEARHEPGGQGSAGRDTLLGGEGNDQILLQSVFSTLGGWNPITQAEADGGVGFDVVHILFPGVLDDLWIDLRQAWQGGSGIVRQRGITSTFDNFEGILSIQAGQGADTILTGDTAGTHILGQEGNDLIKNGRDTAAGTGWNDSMNGGVGSDTLLAYEGADTLTEAGETIAGSHDLLRGGQGDDVFLLGSTRNTSASTVTARGETGDDTFVVNNLVGLLDAGAGFDSLDLDLRRMEGGVVLNLRSIATTGGGTYSAGGIGGVIRGFEDFTIRTSDGNDRVLLGDIGLAVNTRKGSDTVIGGAGADTVFGSGGTLAQTLSGRGGDDSIQAGLAGDALSGDTGQDTLLGYEGSDTLRGGDDADVLRGELGADRLDGGEGADTLIGGDGADRSIGGAGDDFIIVDADVGGYYEGGPTLAGGVDTAMGGEGADTIAVHGVATRVDGGDGHDLLVLDMGEAAVRADLRQPSGAFQVDGINGRILGIESLDATLSSQDDRILLGAQAATIQGQEGSDTLIAGTGSAVFSGGDDDDSLIGGTANDTIEGDGGNDTLRGHGGSNSLVGGDGADLLIGGDGFDTLVGGAGDTLDGGDGANSYVIDFVWDPLAPSAAIILLNATGSYGDGLDLSDIDANPLTAEDDNFREVDALTGTPGEAVAPRDSLTWSLDLDGDAAADLVLQFREAPAFLVIW